MDFLHDYSTHTNIVEHLGGSCAYSQLVADAHQLPDVPCPFCGGHSAISLVDIYMDFAARVTCTTCHASSQLCLAGDRMHYDPDAPGPVIVQVSPLDAISDAYRRWTRRISRPA